MYLSILTSTFSEHIINCARAFILVSSLFVTCFPSYGLIQLSNIFCSTRFTVIRSDLRQGLNPCKQHKQRFPDEEEPRYLTSAPLRPSWLDLRLTPDSATSHDFAPRRVERAAVCLSGADFADVTPSVAFPKETCGRSLRRYRGVFAGDAPGSSFGPQLLCCCWSQKNPNQTAPSS